MGKTSTSPAQTLGTGQSYSLNSPSTPSTERLKWSQGSPFCWPWLLAVASPAPPAAQPHSLPAGAVGAGAGLCAGAGPAGASAAAAPLALLPQPAGHKPHCSATATPCRGSAAPCTAAESTSTEVQITTVYLPVVRALWGLLPLFWLFFNGFGIHRHWRFFLSFYFSWGS